MPLERLIDRELVTCLPQTTVMEAAKLMRRGNIGSILVADESQRPLGIITDRDIAVRCVADQGDCAKIPVTEVMSQPLQSVSVSDGVYNAIQLIKNTGVRRVPVVDDTGKVVAIISLGDLLQLLVHEFSDLTSSTTARTEKLLQDRTTIHDIREIA